VVQFRACEDIALTTKEEPAMKKSVTCLVAAMFVFGSASAFAAKHAMSEKDAKKPTAAECKKDPKMAGCEKKDEMKKK
jgi:hypothetical protein